jgi:hypothetical protein
MLIVMPPMGGEQTSLAAPHRKKAARAYTARFQPRLPIARFHRFLVN